MMSSSPSFSAVSNVSTADSSSHYADIESASRLHLLSKNTPMSASAIFQATKSTSSCVRVLAVVSLVLSCLCLVSVCFFCWVLFLNDGDVFGRQRDGASEVCLPCLQVSPNPLDSSASDLWADLDVRHDENNDTNICCATNTAQYAALFKLILQRQEEVKHFADALESEEKKQSDTEKDPGNALTETPQSVSAHLLFKPRPHAANRRQHWKSPAESPMSHVQGGLKLHHNTLFVQTPGLYFVYCQILYSPSFSPRDVTPVVSTYVKRHSLLHPGASPFLLKSRHTRHDVIQDRHSSYVGGVFQLYAGDTIFVEVSRPELLSHDDVASFFGLFKIGQ